MRKTLLFIALTFAVLASAQAQTPADTVRIVGHVTDGASAGVEGCIVCVLQPADSAIIAYAMTDENGRYAVLFEKRSEEALLRMSGFNVKRQVRRVDARSQTADFRAEEESVVLKEVQVKARKLWGSRDTLNYLVSAYMKDQDRTIGDVLKQLPGITIEGNIIKYQGTPINHFYIENLDVLQGRYGIATEGLKADDVATVQVLENHEHRKALRDQSASESAAINLKLKDKAKGKWRNNVNLGIGYDDGLLWENDINLMYFGKGRQHVFYYGNDNNGTDDDRSARQYGGSGLGAASLVGIVSPSSSPVGKTLYNNMHTVSLNNLWKLDNTRQLHCDLTYRHDIQRRSSHSETSYLLPEGDLQLLCENLSSRHTTNNASVQLQYEDNADKHYLRNTFSLQGDWTEDHGLALSNDETIRQHASGHNLGVSNRTQWVRRTERGGGFQLTSTHSLQSTPQSLAISGDMEARQDIDLTRLNTANHIELIGSMRRHRWTLVPTADLGGTYVSLRSRLQHELVTDATRGSMDYLQAEGRAGVLLRYVKNAFRFKLDLPFSLSYTHMESASGVRLRPTPSFSILWKADDHWTFNGGGDYGASQTPWTRLLTSYVMSDYRTISRYAAELNDTHSASLNAKINFKDILNEFFAYLSASASHTWTDIIYGTTIDTDGRTTIEAQHQPNHSTTLSLAANVSKGFDWHSTRLEATAQYGKAASQILRQSVTTNYHAHNYSLRGHAATDIIPHVRLTYSCTWSLSRSLSGGYRYSVRTFGQEARLSLSLLNKRLLLDLGGSHTHNSGFSGKRDYTFMDAGLTFRTKKRKNEYRLSLDNIFNTRSFVSRSNSDLTEYLTVYHLRPRSIMLSTKISL